MATFPSDHDIEHARELLRRLVDRGNRPRLLADGRITLGGRVTRRELDWAHKHRDAVQAALVGRGDYQPGTLDRIYGLEESMKKLPHPRRHAPGARRAGGAWAGWWRVAHSDMPLLLTAAQSRA